MSTPWAIALAIPAVAAFLLIAWLRRSRWTGTLSDVPNERSLHEVATPRVGGLGLMAAALPVAAVLGDASIGIIVACAAALVLVSAADDVRSLPISVRLPAHFAAATVAILAIASPAPAHAGLGVVEAAVAILAIVWMTNLFNFMDGSDGLAGGMALIGFGTLGLAAALAGQWPLALACAAIASASAGFLAHNLPPARVFLGDAGSIPLGFLAGALGLYGVMSGAWPLALPLAAFSPFILDASATIIRRILRGEPFWKAHRSHYYQRLVLAGWSRRRLAWSAYALMAAAGASALVMRTADADVQFAIIAGWVAFHAALFVAIERSLQTPQQQEQARRRDGVS
jgi:UDP-N-acetylmuramyl pentapeptide phosphotransferase/UDP-N-acetylglucosamine-1-phosphate transferase